MRTIGTWTFAILAILVGYAGITSARASQGADERPSTKLRARCVAAVDQTPEAVGSIAEIVVENRGRVPREPMAFRVEIKPERKGEEPPRAHCLRVDGPWTGRGGRPIAPGRRESFFVLTPFPASRVRSAQVEVIVECDSPAEHELDEPVEVLSTSVETIFVASLNRQLPQTLVEVRNTSAIDLDAVFRVTFDQPAERTSLLSLRLGAGETRWWKIDEVPLHDGALDGAAAKRLELVDWCVLRMSPGDARQLLESVLARWKRSPARVPELASRCRVAFKGGEIDVQVAGEARVLDDGSPDLALDFEPFDREAERVARSIELPFLLLQTPMLDEQLGSCAVDAVIAGKDRVLVLEPPIRIGELVIGAIAYDERRILWHCEDPELSPIARRVEWLTRDEGDRWVLEGLDVFRSGQATPLVLHRFVYESVAGSIVPVRYTRKLRDRTPERTEDLELGLEGWSAALDASAPLPEGAAADALRAAWDAPYRYPDEEVRLRGNFEARTSRRDDPDWFGLESFTGSFVLEGFRRGRWRRARFEVKSHVLDEDQRNALAEIVEWRLRAWFRGDFAARAPFDEAFRGAKLGGSAPRLLVEGRDLVAVELDGGLPSVLLYPGGESRTLGFQQVDSLAVAIAHSSSGRKMRAELGAISPTWRFPRRIELEDADGDADTLLLRPVELASD
jgi:hypothetical protein